MQKFIESRKVQEPLETLKTPLERHDLHKHMQNSFAH
jgi:hypothetical protein